MRKLWLLTVTAALASLGVARPAGADTVRIPIAATVEQVAVTDPGRQWVSEGVSHVRGATAIWRGTGTIGAEAVTGTTTNVANWNLNLNTGDGTAWGTLVTRLDGDDGGFAGTFTATISGFALSGQTIERGFGEWTGWQARTDVQSTGPGRHTSTGYLFNPGG